LRLVYLDEAGISAVEPILCVAGVLIHGDLEILEVHHKLDEIVDRYIPAEDRAGFVFHATDIFHGSRHFKKWRPNERLQILTEIAEIIESLHLPVVASLYEKNTFGTGVPEVLEATHEKKRVIMQTASAMDCAVWAERWLETYAGRENAMIIAEDTDRVKKMMKAAIQLLRTPVSLKASGLDQFPSLPLKRVVETIHFAAKKESPPLQLADLCAFTFGRMMNGKPVPARVASIVIDHVKWISKFKPNVKFPNLTESIAGDAPA
jgi:hypothetical protein